MQRFAVWLTLTLAASGGALAAACGSDAVTKDPILFEDDDREPGNPRPRPDASSDPDPPEPPPPDGGASGRVLAHSATRLYRLEPVTKRLTVIGDFGCLDAGDRVLDIAVDRNGLAFATSDDGFLSVDPLSAACRYITRGANYPNSLSFVPAGTVDATREALVGYAFASGFADRYVRIDTTTGAMTDVGNLNPASATTRYRSSGDIVALINDGNRAYLTVKARVVGDAGVGTDLLAEIDPANGEVKRIIGDTKHKDLYGFGYWSGKGYGFADDGQIIEIDMRTGVGTAVKTIGDAGAPPWFGAGVSTQAPVN